MKTKLKKVESTPEQREMQARINEAHDLMAKTRKAAYALVGACDLMLTVLMDPPTGPDAQKVFDHATRKFYRAMQDTTEAADFYAAKFMVVGKRSPSGWWANRRADVATWWDRRRHNYRAWRTRRAARKATQDISRRAS